MAEFQEVMRQINRMCSHYQNCEDSGCPLSNDCGNIGNYSSNVKQTMRIEKTVMTWAAERPEPVYPTWGDWLEEMGLICWEDSGDGVHSVMVPKFKMCTKIPAVIAEKLGIEPKNRRKE